VQHLPVHNSVTVTSPAEDQIVTNTESTDYEQFNFTMLNDDTDNNNSNFMINPNPAVFSNAPRVEVTLMKIPQEVEAPLWAYEEIMDWVNDAYRTGYNFSPAKRTYGQQIAVLEQWLGMEHMHPTEHLLKLPG
jgi:hypothetical protein